MARHKTRVGGLLPLDNLSSPPGSHKEVSGRMGFKKYTGYRKDPKIVQKLNSASATEFLPPAVAPVKTDVDEEFEPVHDTPLLKKRRFTIQDQATNSILRARFDIPGTLQLFNSQGLTETFSQCLLKFFSDTTESRCSFTSKKFVIKNVNIEFHPHFIHSITFSPQFASMLVTLKNQSQQDGKPTVTKLVWSSNNPQLDKNKLCKLQKILNIRQVDTIIVANEEEFELITNKAHQYPPRHTNYWEKKDFKSLKPTPISNSTSKSRNATILSSPKINTHEQRHSNTVREALMPITRNITTALRTRSHTKVTSNKKSSQEYEQVEDAEEETRELKPDLQYKFDDGTMYCITHQDFRSLYQNEWVNDTIIDFFIKYFVDKSISGNVFSQSSVSTMSSFFYTKLVSSSDYYANVSKWVSDAALFTKKFIIIPININFHWFGCIVTNLDKFYEYTLRQKEDDSITIEAPNITILTFDSLSQTHTREIDPIKEFLVDYAMDKYSVTLDKNHIKMKTCVVPQQPNMNDCGVHVILNIKKFVESPIETIEVWNTIKSKRSSKSSRKTANEFFDREGRSQARSLLRDILWDLHREHTKCIDTSKSSNTDDDEEVQIIENFDTPKEVKQNTQIDEHTNGISQTPNRQSKVPLPNDSNSPYWNKHHTKATTPTKPDLSSSILERLDNMKSSPSKESFEGTQQISLGEMSTELTRNDDLDQTA